MIRFVLALLALLTHALVGAQPRGAGGPAQRFGVNLSGCEFANDPSLCPNEADIDWYVGQGFSLIRIPLKDVHLADRHMRTRVTAIVRYAQAKGAQVILDRHDYKRHSAADALTFWKPVLGDFSPATMIELANEPIKGYPEGSNKWMVSAQDTKETVLLFRKNGITNPILAGWPGWSAIFRADKGERATKPAESYLTAVDRVGGIRDPLGKFYLSGHRYLNKGASGTATACTATGDASVTQWAAAMRKRGLKGYLTEFAFGSHRGVPASCVAVGKALMASVRANSDVILGTTVWGGGRAWGESYIFKVEPKKGTRALAPESAYTASLMGRSSPVGAGNVK